MKVDLSPLLRGLVVLPLLFFSFQVFAAVWQGPFTIKDVRVHYEGSYFVTFEVNEDLVNQTCAHANANDSFAYQSLNENSKAMLSLILSAQAQEKPVMVLVNTHCWTVGQGYWGINICGDDQDCVAPE